jgi:hypothetical protein
MSLLKTRVVHLLLPLTLLGAAAGAGPATAAPYNGHTFLLASIFHVVGVEYGA